MTNNKTNTTIDNAHLYSVYTMLYSNDLACNYIKQIKELIPSEDKEAKRIFGALEKRYKRYFRTIDKLCGKGLMFYADYNGEIDDIIDESKEIYIQAVKDAYNAKDAVNSEYYTRIEIARSFLDLSISTIDSICDDLSKNGKECSNLKTYRLLDMQNIMKNFAKWAYRKIDFDIDFNEMESVTSSFDKFADILFDYRSFEKAYETAVRYEKENKNNSSNS